MKINKLFIAAVLILATVLIVGLLVLNKQNAKPQKEKPTRTDLNGFWQQQTFYSCSKEIHGEWFRTKNWQGIPDWEFQPSDSQEFQKYCKVSDTQVEFEYF